MSNATLLPELMTRSARSMREVLREQAPPALSADEASQLVATVLALVDGFRAAGKSIESALEMGQSGPKAAVLGEINWQACSGWLALLEEVRSHVGEVGHRSDWLANLDRAIAEAAESKTKASQLKAFFTRPLRPYDPRALERAKAAHARGERGEDLAILLERLQAREEI